MDLVGTGGAKFNFSHGDMQNVLTDEGQIKWSSGLADHDNRWIIGSMNVLYDNQMSRARISFLRLKLKQSYPHIIIRQHRTIRDPSHYLEKTYIRLEGDFSDSFDVYGDKTLPGQVTLEVLTPDIMAYMIDHLSDYDIELRGDYLWMYWGDTSLGIAPEIIKDKLETAALFAIQLRHH